MKGVRVSTTRLYIPAMIYHKLTAQLADIMREAGGYTVYFAEGHWHNQVEPVFVVEVVHECINFNEICSEMHRLGEEEVFFVTNGFKITSRGV